MSEMFKNYPQPDDYIPNNRPKCHCCKKLEIMAGETAIHTFEVPLKVEELENVEVIYKLGIEPIIVKDLNGIIYTDDEDSSIITITLYPYETSLFAHTSLDAKVQIKFILPDNVVEYSDIYNIKLLNALDVTKA